MLHHEPGHSIRVKARSGQGFPERACWHRAYVQMVLDEQLRFIGVKYVVEARQS